MDTSRHNAFIFFTSLYWSSILFHLISFDSPLELPHCFVSQTHLQLQLNSRSHRINERTPYATRFSSSRSTDKLLI
ncbi:hypothetical protein BDV26DRAFT_257806 [Aspergillus bertholletiae]|uniref:Uncharacterized protein n=1 Tax=Aspergillus bertholletiae TaxID=1226010 RepID=A0A5N7BEW9_9EURO|nr:hypothetical protein BDV26DRAFT_257806 [Aspergillus bertholletiae]